MEEEKTLKSRPRRRGEAQESETRARIVDFVESGVHGLVPHISVDCSIFGFHAGELKILLVKWKGVDRWCLPGGYVRQDESLDEAAYHVLEEIGRAHV